MVIELKHCKKCNQMTNHREVWDETGKDVEYKCLKCELRKTKELREKLREKNMLFDTQKSKRTPLEEQSIADVKNMRFARKSKKEKDIEIVSISLVENPPKGCEITEVSSKSKGENDE